MRSAPRRPRLDPLAAVRAADPHVALTDAADAATIGNRIRDAVQRTHAFTAAWEAIGATPEGRVAVIRAGQEAAQRIRRRHTAAERAARREADRPPF